MAGDARARRKAQRPGDILEAAFEEFRRKGYAATRLEDVAIRAGMTKGTIYFYFESKERVFETMIRELSKPIHEKVEAFSQEIETRSSAFSGAQEFLAAFLRGLYRIIAENERSGEIFRLLIAEAPRFPELVDEHHRNFMEPLIQRVRRRMADGVESGEIRRIPALDFPELFLSPLLMIKIWTLLFSDRKPLDLAGHVESAIDLLLYGLAPRP